MYKVRYLLQRCLHERQTPDQNIFTILEVALIGISQR